MPSKGPPGLSRRRLPVPSLEQDPASTRAQVLPFLHGRWAVSSEGFEPSRLEGRRLSTDVVYQFRHEDSCRAPIRERIGAVSGEGVEPSRPPRRGGQVARPSPERSEHSARTERRGLPRGNRTPYAGFGGQRRDHAAGARRRTRAGWVAPPRRIERLRARFVVSPSAPPPGERGRERSSDRTRRRGQRESNPRSPFEKRRSSTARR